MKIEQEIRELQKRKALLKRKNRLLSEIGELESGKVKKVKPEPSLEGIAVLNGES